MKKYLLIAIPNLFVYFLLILILAKQYFMTDEIILVDNLFFYLTSFASAFFLSLYLYILRRGKKSSLKSKANVFALFFYVLFFITIFRLIDRSLDLDKLSYIVFVLSLLSRLTNRLVFGGFPLMSFIFNYFSMFLALNGIYFFWIPVLYVTAQIIEDAMKLHYDSIDNLLKSKKNIEWLFYASMAGFYIAFVIINEGIF